MIQNKSLKRRIIEISYKNKLSHLGSCLTAVDIIEEIYQIKKPDEKFVLSSGHAGLALYVVLEKHDTPKYLGDGVYDFKRLLDAEKVFEHHGVHPDRCEKCHIDCSTGSLGQGLSIAAGMALADRSKNVYCLISDGECSEGSVWEALRIINDYKIYNIRVFLNYNGFGAYQKIEKYKLQDRIKGFGTFVYWRDTNVEQLPFLKGQDAHYKIMSEEDYKEAIRILK